MKSALAVLTIRWIRVVDKGLLRIVGRVGLVDCTGNFGLEIVGLARCCAARSSG